MTAAGVSQDGGGRAPLDDQRRGVQPWAVCGRGQAGGLRGGDQLAVGLPPRQPAYRGVVLPEPLALSGPRLPLRADPVGAVSPLLALVPRRCRRDRHPQQGLLGFDAGPREAQVIPAHREDGPCPCAVLLCPRFVWQGRGAYLATRGTAQLVQRVAYSAAQGLAVNPYLHTARQCLEGAVTTPRAARPHRQVLMAALGTLSTHLGLGPQPPRPRPVPPLRLGLCLVLRCPCTGFTPRRLQARRPLCHRRRCLCTCRRPRRLTRRRLDLRCRPVLGLGPGAKAQGAQAFHTEVGFGQGNTTPKYRRMICATLPATAAGTVL